MSDTGPQAAGKTWTGSGKSRIAHENPKGRQPVSDGAAPPVSFALPARDTGDKAQTIQDTV